MDQGNVRVPCPRCRANNFPGTPACWQCGGSLPPPESFAAPGAYAHPVPVPMPAIPAAPPPSTYLRGAYVPPGYMPLYETPRVRRPWVAVIAFFGVVILVGGGAV